MDKKITTFIFDCFGVVCDSVLYSWYEKNSVKYDFTDNNLPNILKQFDLGILSEDNLVDYFLKYKGINLTREELREDIDSYLKMDQNLAYVIKRLKEKGYKTVLLSNGNHSFFERKIYKTYPEFKNLFDEIIISSLVNTVKPDAEIYLHTLKKIKSKPEESLFIDDRKPNVDAAILLGMEGFIYTDSSSFMEKISSMGINLSST